MASRKVQSSFVHTLVKAAGKNARTVTWPCSGKFTALRSVSKSVTCGAWVPTLMAMGLPREICKDVGVEGGPWHPDMNRLSGPTLPWQTRENRLRYAGCVSGRPERVGSRHGSDLRHHGDSVAPSRASSGGLRTNRRRETPPARRQARASHTADRRVHRNQPAASTCRMRAYLPVTRHFV